MKRGDHSDADKVFDAAVGRRIRTARLAADMNQTALGDRAGVTFQQIQKYENGTNRVSASRMSLIAQAVGVSCAHLMGEADQSAETDVRASAEIARLITLYKRCGVGGQKAIRNLAESLAS